MNPDASAAFSPPSPEDSNEALRRSIEALTYECPKRDYEESCPFKIIGGLSPASRRGLLAGLSTERLAALFDLAHSCVCPADPRVIQMGGRAEPNAKAKK